MRIPEGKAGEAMEILASFAERTRVRSGCLGIRIYQDTQDVCVIMVEELWKDRETLDRHLRSNDYRRVLLVVEMALEKPEIRFDEVAHSTGLETIEKARTPGLAGPVAQ
jgi:quinol monooxygenase YgiN